MKEFSTVFNCSDSELGAKVNAGWQIQFMQVADDKLHVVFVRDVTPAVAPVPTVTVTPASAPKPIANQPLINAMVMGLPDSPHSVPLTTNKFKPGDTRKVNVPVGDPVMRKAYEQGQAVYEQAMANGEAKIKQSRPNFMRGV